MRHIAATAGAAGVIALTTAYAAPASAAPDATVTVFHGVPDLTVDVYANGKEVISNFEPGQFSDPLSLPAGTYDLQVFADGETPKSDTPAIEANDVKVTSGLDATVAAHLQENGNPTMTVFANDMAPVAAGESRLTVRHVAAAPAVDVRADGSTLFEGLANPEDASADVPAGTYRADVVPTGTDQVVLGPADLDLAEGAQTIAYAWGSADDGTLQLASQAVGGLHSAPSGVPGGETGLAAGSAATTFPWWALGLGLASGAVLTVAGRKLVTVRPRR
jgi:hypothetical protein